MVILFKQLYMYNWPRRIIHILYGWSLTHRGQFPYRDYFHIGRAYTRTTFLDVLFGFLYLYIHLLFGLATSI